MNQDRNLRLRPPPELHASAKPVYHEMRRRGATGHRGHLPAPAATRRAPAAKPRHEPQAGHTPAGHTTNTRQGAMDLMTSTNPAVALRGATQADTGPQADTGCIAAPSSTWAAALAGDGQEAAK